MPRSLHIGLVTLFHLLPLWPLVMGHFPLAVATALLVVMPYIKTQKLAAQLAVIEASQVGGAPLDIKTVRIMEEIRVSYRRFKALTFL